jgi:hypothetical protein
MRSIPVEVGRQLGSWTVLEADVPYNGKLGLRVRCVCGAEAVRLKRNLLSGDSTSCGKCGSRKGLPGNPKTPVKVGREFGSWTVIEVAGLTGSDRHQKVGVRCACGTEAVRDLRSLIEERSTSCGKCGSRSGTGSGNPKTEVKIGDEFGRWVVIGLEPSRNGQQRVKVRCVCSLKTEGVRYLASLRKGLLGDDVKGGSTSCGCYRREFMQERDVKHGLARAGKVHPLYVVWLGCMNRCHNENDSRYADYGAQGVMVWEPWHDPVRFVRDVEREIGLRPDISSPHEWSLDRLNNLKGYEPGNVAWSTPDQQSRNRRNVIRRVLACECGVGIEVVGQVSWWRCLSCGQEHVVLREDQRRKMK